MADGYGALASALLFSCLCFALVAGAVVVGADSHTKCFEEVDDNYDENDDDDRDNSYSVM